MTDIPVFNSGQLCGFMVPGRVRRSLGATGLNAAQVEEIGTAERTELCELRDGRLVVLEYAFVDGIGTQCHRAELIDRMSAEAWLIDNEVRPPDDWLVEMGLVDLTPRTPEDEQRERDNASLSDPTTDAGTRGRTAQPGQKIAKAIGLLALHPEWTNAQIAAEAGVHEKSLSRNEKFKAARQAIKAVGKLSHRRSNRTRGTSMDEYEY